MPKIVHFEIPADDPEKAIAFYREVFGWKIESWGGPMEYWLARTGDEGEGGIDGAIMRREHPGQTPINIIDVPDLDEFMDKIVAHGGKKVADKVPVPGVGWAAYAMDTEGNVFGLLQPDPDVK